MCPIGPAPTADALTLARRAHGTPGPAGGHQGARHTHLLSDVSRRSWIRSLGPTGSLAWLRRASSRLERATQVRVRTVGVTTGRRGPDPVQSAQSRPHVGRDRQVSPLVGHLAVWENPPVAVFAEVRDVIDQHILQRIVARDATAVAELYDQYGSVLYGVILRILGRRPDADEVLQEVLIRVWTRAETYDETCGAPAAWLVRVARNRAIDCLRARRARGDVDVPEAHSLDTRHGTAAAVSTPESLAAAAEQRGAMRDALAALPDEQRSLIEAAFFEGYTHRELADRFGLPLGTVKTRIRNGMMTLRQRLERSV